MRNPNILIKKTRSFTFLLLLFVSVFTFANANSSNVLKIRGSISCKGNCVSRALVTIYVQDKVLDNILSDSKGFFELTCLFDREYLLELAGKGFITQKILINTSVPEEFRTELNSSVFQFQVNLLQYFSDVNTSLFEKPVVKYYFDSDKKGFIEDKTLYYELIESMNSISYQVNQKRIEAYNYYLSLGDDNYLDGNIEDAFLAYKTAAGFTSTSNKLNSKLKSLHKSISGMSDAGNRFQAHYENGEKFFKLGEYNQADLAFNKALLYAPTNTLLLSKIATVDSIQSVLFKNRKANYLELVKNGDIALVDKRLYEAKSFYTKASGLFPNEILPKNKLDETNKLIAEFEARNKRIERKYKTLVEDGEKYFSMQLFADAIEKFNEALKIKPDEEGLKESISASEEMLEAQKIKQDKELQQELEYIRWINKAAEAWQMNQYDSARNYYEQALLVYPEKTELLTLIDSLSNIISSNLTTEENIPEHETEEIVFGDYLNLEVIPIDSDSSKIALYKEINAFKLQARKQIYSHNQDSLSKIYSKIAGLYHQEDNLNNAIDFYSKAIDLKEQQGDDKAKAVLLNDLAVAYYDSGRYETAVDLYKESLEIFDERGNSDEKAITLEKIATVYSNTYRYEKALDYYEQLLVINEDNNDKEAVTNTLEKMADVYFQQNDFEKSIDAYKYALNVVKSANNKQEEGTLLNSLGSVYYEQGNFDAAIEYFEKSIIVTKETGNQEELSMSYNNIGNVNYDWSNYEDAISYYNMSLEIKKGLGFQEGIAASLYNIGNAMFKMKNYEKAVENFQSSIELAQKVSFTELLHRNYLALSKLYKERNMFQQAFENYQLAIEYKYPGEDSKVQFVERTNQYELANTRKQVKSLKKELKQQKILADFENNRRRREVEIQNLKLENSKVKLKRQQTMLVFSIAGVILMLVIAVQLYRNLKQRNKANELISYQKEQIEDSIRYARRIQTAILPPKLMIKERLPDHFILNRPRDIVSGDYYWVTKRGDETIVAVADCTGHGVPGAFMSMLGVAFLNEIVGKNQDIRSFEILNQLREQIIKSLHQTGKDDETKDGMDIALCIINHSTKRLEYSGANNPLYYVRNKKLHQLMADRMPIGIHPIKTGPFSSKIIEVEEGDIIYIFTDGIVDQIGGPDYKKFMFKRFKDLVLKNHNLPMAEQKDAFEQATLAWKGNEEQTDDILLMGFKV